MNSKNQKQEKIKEYVASYEVIETLANLDAALLDFRPFEEAWTIRENILHLLDADLNGILRLRKAFAQNGTPIVTYDEEKWTKNLSYTSFEVKPVIGMTKALREMTAQLLTSKIDEDWDSFGYSHPDNGVVSVNRWVDIYIDHVDFHWKLIERNKAAFRG